METLKLIYATLKTSKPECECDSMIAQQVKRKDLMKKWKWASGNFIQALGYSLGIC